MTFALYVKLHSIPVQQVCTADPVWFQIYVFRTPTPDSSSDYQPYMRFSLGVVGGVERVYVAGQLRDYKQG